MKNSLRAVCEAVVLSAVLAAFGSAKGLGAPAASIYAEGQSGLLIADNGAPAATIVLSAGLAKADSKDANAKNVLTAARDLQLYIEKISGAKLPIVHDDKGPQGALILVGKSRLTDRMQVEIPSGLTNNRREEGFVMVCKGDRLLLAGNDEGPYHGTEYAVYDFLERLGVRWFMPGEFGEIVPKRATIRVRAIQVRRKPDFVMRNWWLRTTAEMVLSEGRWKIRNKMNPDSMFAIPTDSSVRRLINSALFEEHPEYFAMDHRGRRDKHLPNISHPEAVRIAADIIKTSFRKDPTSNSYGFAPDDGIPRDFNPETVGRNQGFVGMYGRPNKPEQFSMTEEWIMFVNDVTREVRKEFPDIYIATNGYSNRDVPPQGVELDDHLVIMFAAIWSDTLHAYDDPKSWQMVRHGRMLKRWCELSDNVWIYGYNYTMLVSGLTPTPRVRKLKRDFPLMKKWGVMGFLDETRNVWMECGITTRYVRAKLLWDADADVGAILDDFFAKWYGKAAGPAAAFWDALEEAIEQTPMLGHEDRIMPWVYTPKLLAALEGHVARAEKLADTPRTKTHVRADRLILKHLNGYMAMHAAEFAAEFAEAARQAQYMLDQRKELHAISSFFTMPDETYGYKDGTWYWGVSDRKKHYESLADRMSGKTGDLVAVVPEKAKFRTDPHDDGRFEDWYAPDLPEEGWHDALTTKPFYLQGYMDAQGHTYMGRIWYRLNVDVPASAKGKKVVLHAPTIEGEAWCWVNGKYIGHRPFVEIYVRPGSEMALDVTDAILPGQTNQVSIRVNTTYGSSYATSGLLSRMVLYSPKETPPAVKKP